MAKRKPSKLDGSPGSNVLPPAGQFVDPPLDQGDDLLLLLDPLRCEFPGQIAGALLKGELFLPQDRGNLWVGELRSKRAAVTATCSPSRYRSPMALTSRMSQTIPRKVIDAIGHALGLLRGDTLVLDTADVVGRPAIPQIAELLVSEQEDLVYIRTVGGVGFEGVQSLTDLRNNWNRLLDAADLTPDERHEAVWLFNERVAKLPGTSM